MKKKRMYYGVLAAAALAMLTGSALTASADAQRWNSTTATDANGSIILSFEPLQLTLPQDWSGRCQMMISDRSVQFYQTKSRQLYTEEYGEPNGGWLFSIAYSTDTSFNQSPVFEPLAKVPTANGTEYYFAEFPSDVQGYVEDAAAMEEYGWMCEDIEGIIDSITFLIPGAEPIIMEEEYIFPYSSYELLSDEDFAGMTDDELQMAINEIYARHNRRFVRQDVQDYFDSKTWYCGLIEASDFDSSLITSLEWTNIDRILKYMERTPDEITELIITASEPLL